MRLNADIIYHNLKDTLDVTIYGMCETELALYRPEFYLDRSSRFLENHVYVCSADHLPEDPVIEDNVRYPAGRISSGFSILSRVSSTNMRPGRLNSAGSCAAAPPCRSCWRPAG